MSKPLPIGVEDFEQICTEDYYYIDKTLFVKEILEKKSKVNLFTRPRRFGKTLTLSMLQYYFEDAYDRRGNKKDYSHLFEDKKIALVALKHNLSDEFTRHRYILQDCVMTTGERKV